MSGTLTGAELIKMFGPSNSRFRPSGEDFYGSAQDIANLGGGGGISEVFEVTTGTTTVSGEFGTYYVFNSATNSQKYINAPPATGSGDVIKGIDMYGDAGGNGVQGPNQINFVPDGDDIVIGNQDQIYTNNGSQTWRDLLPGVWGAE